LEKVKAKVPNSEKTTPVLILFDGGSGTTVGNHLEDLDEFETQQTRNIVLSSLNGVDRAQKRVCQITLIGEKGVVSLILPITGGCGLAKV